MFMIKNYITLVSAMCATLSLYRTARKVKQEYEYDNLTRPKTIEEKFRVSSEEIK
jgi:hypothetical protein